MINIFVIIDGIGDRPTKILANKTALEAAHTPNLDYFASEGKTGMVYTVKKGLAPESDEAIWALLGHDITKNYISRGPIEAYGANMHFDDGDLVLRANFASMKGDKIIDRRVGRSLTSKEARELADAINKRVRIGFPFEFRHTVGHRGILLIKGKFSDKISNCDPAYRRIGNLGVAKEVKTYYTTKSRPLNRSLLAKKSAILVNEFTKQAREILSEHVINKRREKKGLLKANAILLRDAGNKVPQKNNKFLGWGAVTGMPLEKGIARLHGMHIFDYRADKEEGSSYSDLYKGLDIAIENAKRYLRQMDYHSYLVHFKETDIPGHDGRAIDKQKMIEVIDKKFFSYLRTIEHIRLVVTGDHSTPCSLKRHSADPVPLLIYGHGRDGCVSRFNEESCKKGSLGYIKGKDVLKIAGFIR